MTATTFPQETRDAVLPRLPVSPAPTSPQAKNYATPDVLLPVETNFGNSDHVISDTHRRVVAVADLNLDSGSHRADDIHIETAPAVDLFDPLLVIHAEALDDIEQLLHATNNRLRAMTTEHGLTDAHPDLARLRAMAAMFADLEKDAIKNLERAMKRHPLGPWVKATVGVGDKQGARLLAAIGDPYWHVVEDRPRTVSQLWAYSGLHVLPATNAGSLPIRGASPGSTSTTGGDAQTRSDTQGLLGVAARRRKGVQSNWSTNAKTRAYLIAAKCMQMPGVVCKNGTVKPRSPFRDTYDDRRARTAVTHPDWSDGHSHNDALRITSKEILKQLWREAKRLHEEAA